VPDKPSHFSRFTMKFIEIVAAGVATAVSGYLVAHLGGYWSAPAPAAVQVAPSMSAVSKSPRPEPAQPVSADAGEQRLAPAQDVTSSTPPATRTIANAPAPAARKRAATESGAAESRPRERDKDDRESIEARVRAALAKADANRPAPATAPPPQADVPSVPAVAMQPRPADSIPGTAAIAAAPRTDVTPQPQLQPLPQAPPIQTDPLTTVEIKSRPVADVAAMPAAAQASIQGNAPEEKGFLATIKRIPDLLRGDAPAPVSAPTAATPRPPLPVGE
jgi:hypothetical protein